MKKLVELTGGVIKTQNKETTEALKELHYKINGYIHFYNYRYISPMDAQDLYTILCGYGKEISDLKVNEKAEPKRQEILQKLRTICQALKAYGQTQLTKDDIDGITGSTRFQVSQYIKAKKEDNLDDDKIIELLKEHKRIRINMLEPYSEIQHIAPYSAFDKMPAELLKILEEKYK